MLPSTPGIDSLKVETAGTFQCNWPIGSLRNPESNKKCLVYYLLTQSYVYAQLEKTLVNIKFLKKSYINVPFFSLQKL